MITFFPCNQFFRTGINFQSLKCYIKYNFNSSSKGFIFISAKHAEQLDVVNFFM